METTIKEKQGRGQLTDRIKKRSVELLGYGITVRELRLFPFIQHTLCNNQKIIITYINNEEMEFLAKYVKLGYILEGITENGRPMMNTSLKITKEFWNIMNEILWLGYVDLN